MVSALRVTDRHDHDRESAICLDAVREADAGRHGLEALGYSIRVHAVHSVSDLDPAARWVADRSAGTARLYQRGGHFVRTGLGRAGLRNLPADAVWPLLRGGCGRGIRLQRIDWVGSEVVQG